MSTYSPPLTAGWRVSKPRASPGLYGAPPMKDKKKNKNGKHEKNGKPDKLAAAESPDILGPTDAEREAIVALLRTAYGMELETVQNYLANSVNLDGVRAEQIKLALNADVAGELAHATLVANRIKQLG